MKQREVHILVGAIVDKNKAEVFRKKAEAVGCNSADFISVLIDAVVSGDIEIEEVKNKRRKQK